MSVLKTLTQKYQITASTFPSTLYIQPDHLPGMIGKTYIYDKAEMTLILKKFKGYSVSLADCEELKLILKEQDFAVYESKKTKKKVKIVKIGGEFKAKWLSGK